MYYTYVLQIKQDGKFYTGFTKNLKLFNRVNQEALAIEFKMQEMPYKQQQVIEIMYKEKPLEKKYQPDFLCFGEIIARPPRLSELGN